MRRFPLTILVAGAVTMSYAVEMIPRIVVKGPLDAMKGHVQGAGASEEAIYFSHVAGIFKIDWNGNVLKHVEAARHTGDLCCHGGKVYSVLGTWGSNGQTKVCRLQVWDADLNFLSEKEIPGLAGIDGVTVLDGIIYHGIGNGSSDPNASHALGRIDMKTMEPLPRLAFELPYKTHFGPQNLTTDGTSLYMAFYPVKGAPYAISSCDRNGRLASHYTLRAGLGFERLPHGKFPGAHPRFLKVNSSGGKQKDGKAKPFSVTIDFYELADGTFRSITEMPLQSEFPSAEELVARAKAAPSLMFRAVDLPTIRRRLAEDPDAKAWWEGFLRALDANVAKGVKMPPRGAQWAHWYSCRKCGEVYTGWPYDDAYWYPFQHRCGELVRDAGVAWAITGERRYADVAKGPLPLKTDLRLSTSTAI